MESIQKSDFSLQKRSILLHTFVTGSQIPSNITTIFPRSSDPNHTVSSYIRWVTTSWTYSIIKQIRLLDHFSHFVLAEPGLKYAFAQIPHAYIESWFFN